MVMTAGHEMVRSERKRNKMSIKTQATDVSKIIINCANSLVQHTGVNLCSISSRLTYDDSSFLDFVARVESDAVVGLGHGTECLVHFSNDGSILQQ